ncbi:MAG: hypothetical protein KF749_00545 [Bacteroidetes bacterium]|nr:hypothetical protein [Bacteroidota bacterium]MCW5895117.1 hypothetical protein [Bacteroidota bacterium]
MNVSDIRNTPVQLPVHKKQTRPAPEESFDAALKNIPAEILRTDGGKQTPSPVALTQTEQAFFERLYPDDVDEVRSYNPYQGDRAPRTVKLGTLIDRKG